MLSKIFGTLMAAAENGSLPDSACRAGIRRLLKQRLQALESGGVEQQQEVFRKFLVHCRDNPIAVVPEMANEQHYEVPAAFFESALGAHLKYSCCEWRPETKTLEQAEIAAMKTTCARADLQDGQQILELGCGWGSLSLWMAEHYPQSSILAVSNSASQRAFIETKAAEKSLSNLTVTTTDMNNFAPQQTFDRVVTVEMFEHMRNHEELLRRISTWLNPTGKLFVHIFCHRLHAYLFEATSEQDWMARHFFSGGMMPSEHLLAHYQQHLTLDDAWRWDDKHYERTCNEWLKRQDSSKPQLKELFAKTYGADQAEIWFNRWRIFFMSCAELFGYRNGSEWWVSHYLF